MKKLFDLRFVIGLFFLAVGILLLGYHFLSAESKASGSSVNMWGGLLYLVFGLGMVLLSYSGKEES